MCQTNSHRPMRSSGDRRRSNPVQTPRADGRHVESGAIWLAVNGEIRQQADVRDLIWGVPELIAELSTLFELAPGDLIYTGTPAGVSAVKPGDRMEGAVEGLDTLVTTIQPGTDTGR